MTGAYSQDLRKRVIAAIEPGASCRAAASRYAVSVSTVVNWRRRWLATGTAAAKPMGGTTNTRIIHPSISLSTCRCTFPSLLHIHESRLYIS